MQKDIDEVGDMTQEASRLIVSWIDRDFNPVNMVLVFQVMAAVVYGLHSLNPNYEEFSRVLNYELKRVYNKSETMVDNIRERAN